MLRLNLPLPRLNHVTICLASIATIWGGGWLINWLVVRAFLPLAKPFVWSESPREPSVLENYGIMTRQFLSDQSYWMVGSLLTLAMFACLHIALESIPTWRRADTSESDFVETIAGTRTLLSLLGVTFFFTLAVIWLDW